MIAANAVEFQRTFPCSWTVTIPSNISEYRRQCVNNVRLIRRTRGPIARPIPFCLSRLLTNVSSLSYRGREATMRTFLADRLTYDDTIVGFDSACMQADRTAACSIFARASGCAIRGRVAKTVPLKTARLIFPVRRELASKSTLKTSHFDIRIRLSSRFIRSEN